MYSGLLILRLVVGLTFVAHGSQKLFGWFGGGGTKRMAPYFEQIGLHPGITTVMMAGLAELCGGLLLALGFLTPLGAALIAGTMFVATMRVHLQKGFFAANGGFELPLILAASAVSLAFIGPGPWSLDYLAGIHWSGWAWGVAAFVLGVVGGAIELVVSPGKQPHERPPAGETHARA